MSLEQELLKFAYENYAKGENPQYTINTQNSEERFLYFSCLDNLIEEGFSILIQDNFPFSFTYELTKEGIQYYLKEY